MTKTWDVLTLAGTLGCAAVGGVFLAFSSFIMPGLARLPAAQGIAAMKSINITAVRPLFMLALFGSAVVCVALIVQAIRTWGDRRASLLLAGSVVYLLGVVVLTIAFHVPRNDRLAALSDTHSSAAASAWHTYVGEWTAGNHVRAAAGLLAAALLVLALLSERGA